MKKQSAKSIITISKNNLSSDYSIAYDTIHNLFSEFELTIIENDVSFQISLERTNYDYCEILTAGLKALHFPLDETLDHYHLTHNACLCLSENWLPFCLQCLIRNHTCKRKTAIIHIDDHSDLMSPFISYSNGRYTNILSKYSSVSLDPSFLKNAIETGAITIGSMLTIITYILQDVNIYHLKRKATNFYKGISKQSYFDHILEVPDRIGIEYNDNLSNNTYFQTGSMDEINKILKYESEIILHIDMDYLNNRFNGSTSWKEEKRDSDYPIDEQKHQIRIICKHLEAINKRIPIKLVMIGVSPSFYPVQYWKEGCMYLLKRLRQSGIEVNDLIRLLE